MNRNKPKNAATLTGAAETDKLSPAYLEQIMRNCNEDYGFAEILNKFKRKEYAHQGTITICRSPLALALVGANVSLDLVVNPSTLVKCMSSPETKYHGHDLDADMLKYLVFELRNPTMIFKGTKEESFVFLTDLKDKKGRPVIVITALNRRNGRKPVNQITSAYGRDNFSSYLERQIKNGNLIAVNKNKANLVFQSSGHDWPIEEIPISFDNSISYTLENVKGLLKENSKKFSEPAIISPVGKQSDYENNNVRDNVGNVQVLQNNYEEVIEMVRFFEYAGAEIYNSLLWYQFQQDKDFIKDGNVVSKLQDVLGNAQNLEKYRKGKDVDYIPKHELDKS